MSKKALTIGLIVMVIINIILIAMMVFHSGRHYGRGNGPSRMLKHHLDFTELQEEQFELLRTKHFDAVEPKMKMIGNLKRQLINTLDHSIAQKLTEQIGQLEGEIDLLTFEHFTAVREICTEEQQAKMDEMKQRMVKHIIEGHGPPFRRGR